MTETCFQYFDYVLLRLSYPSYAQAEGKWEDNLAMLRQIDEDPSQKPEYDVQYKLLNSANYGVPQTRERVFIIGTRSNLGVNFVIPEPTHSKKVLLQHQKVTNALNDVPHPASNHQIENHVFKDGAKSYPGHTGSYIDLPAKTLKAGVHGVPGGENMIRYEDGSIRYFTVHEGKLLQTFPANYHITGAWGEGMRQIGNAVPVQLARILGEAIFEALSATKSNKKPVQSVG